MEEKFQRVGCRAKLPKLVGEFYLTGISSLKIIDLARSKICRILDIPSSTDHGFQQPTLIELKLYHYLDNGILTLFRVDQGDTEVDDCLYIATETLSNPQLTASFMSMMLREGRNERCRPSVKKN